VAAQWVVVPPDLVLVLVLVLVRVLVLVLVLVQVLVQWGLVLVALAVPCAISRFRPRQTVTG